MLIKDSEIRQIADSRERFEVFHAQLKEARVAAADTVRVALAQNGLNQVMTAEILGCDVALVHRSIKKQYSLTAEATVKLCYSIMNVPCHSIYSAEPAVTILPRRLSMLANVYKSGKATDRLRYSQYVMDAQTQEHQKGTWYAQPLVERIGERIYEAAADRAVLPGNLCGTDELFNTKTSLMFYADQKDKDTTKLRLGSLFYFAVMMNTTLDYLIAPDYVTNTDVCLFWDKERKPLTDKALKFFLSKFLTLTAEDQEMVMAQIIADAMTA